MLNILLLAAGIATTPLIPPEVKGTLCLNTTSRCSETTATTVEVAPEPGERLWTWRSADGKRVVIGKLPPNKGAVELDGGDLRTVTLAVAGDRSRDWPSKTTFSVIGGVSKWKWDLPATDVAKLKEIRLGAGRHRLDISAPHHFLATREIAADKDVSLSTVALKPLPVVRGRIVRMQESEKVPVIGAHLQRDDGKVQTTSTVDGSFEAELPEPIPSQLLVVAPGLSTSIVRLKNLQPETDLGDIVVDKGRLLSIAVTRPSDGSVGDVTLRLLKQVEGEHELTPIQTRALSSKETSTIFEDLSSGRYAVVAAGGAALEHQTVWADVRDASNKAEVAIKPFRLEGSALFGDDPLKNGSLQIVERGWTATIEFDAEGKFGGWMWESGRVGGFLHAAQLGGGTFVQSPELGVDPSEWKIRIPKRVIEGVVLDEKTRQPLSNVRLAVKRIHADSAGMAEDAVGADGRYTVVATNDGTYDLRFFHPERVEVTRTFQLDQQTTSQKFDVLLKSGVETTLEVVGASGAPLPEAMLIEGVAADGYNPSALFRTDANGRLSLRLQEGETKTLYVLPKDGSLAVARVTAQNTTPQKPVRIVVPPPIGALRIETVDDQQQPADGLLLMRFNGEWLPFPVVRQLQKERLSKGMNRYVKLPPGTFEVWAVRPSATDFIRAVAAPPSAPAVAVGVSAGESTAKVVVRP